LDHPIGRVSRRLNSGISGISRSRGSPQSTRRSFAESRERQLTILADRGWRFGRSWAIPRRLIAGVLAANLSACAVASVSSPTETTMASVLTSADSGKTIDLRVGAEAALRLPENPSTGFRWAIDAADANLAEIKQGAYDPASKAVGGGGQAQWLIKAKAPGATTIKLKRWRQWEGESSVVERFEITLRISP
jgi:inhibitor of cysteine peptidase